MEILGKVLLGLESTVSPGYLTTTDFTDSNSFPVVSKLLPCFIQNAETEEFINGAKSMESYKLIYNVVILTLYL